MRNLTREDRGREIALRPKAGPAELSWADTARGKPVAELGIAGRFPVTRE